MALASGEGILFLLRWLHLLAGVTWIGILYYFNLVQTPFFATAAPAVRSGMIAGGLLDRALWWFRWSAMVTFVTGWLILLHRAFAQFGGVDGFLATSYGWKILFGGMLGTVMWLNVWFVIWPGQRVVMASALQVARGGMALPEAAARGARAGLASRTNTVLSIPMLFFMGAAMHLAVPEPARSGGKLAALVLLLVVLVGVEINALVGSAAPGQASVGKRLLGPISATLVAGFVLTAVLYIGLVILLR